VNASNIIPCPRCTPQSFTPGPSALSSADACPLRGHAHENSDRPEHAHDQKEEGQELKRQHSNDVHDDLDTANQLESEQAKCVPRSTEFLHAELTPDDGCVGHSMHLGRAFVQVRSCLDILSDLCFARVPSY
jgi:hypothetical protein